MRKEATPSGILEWIGRNSRPGTTDSAALRFERMESQSGYALPEVHLPLDHREPGHWHHRGMIWDYVLALEGAERVLDVGPGDGWPSLLLARHFKEVVGIEPGAKRIAACRANAQKMRTRKAHFEMMSACDMSFRPSSFDGAVAATSIEQTPDPAAALSEIYRVLKVGGSFRMTYETFDQVAEPVREAVAVSRGSGGTYLVDYVVSWTEKALEQGFLLEVTPLTDGGRKRLEVWARRCEGDPFPHRDPRLERGLAQTVRAIRKSEIQNARTFRLRHFKPPSLVKLLERVGFVDIRCIIGGGWPARQCAHEMIQARRIEAAAPLMEEICRGAARIGLSLPTTRPGNIIARKPRGRVAAARRKPVKRAAPRTAKRGKTARRR
jgi:SAM-dependent methyltransferase